MKGKKKGRRAGVGRKGRGPKAKAAKRGPTLDECVASGRLIAAALIVVANTTEINAGLLDDKLRRMGLGKFSARAILRAIDAAKPDGALPKHNHVNVVAVANVLAKVPQFKIEQRIHDDGHALDEKDLAAVGAEQIAEVKEVLGDAVDRKFDDPVAAKDWAAAHELGDCPRVHSHPVLNMALCPTCGVNFLAA